MQAWVPRVRVEAAMAGDGVGPIARATALGAASSSCSYAAIAIAKSLFQKGASAASALAFQFASTNLVWELGLVLWVLIGWQFALAEYVGGLVMIVLMWALLRRFVSRPAEEAARDHARHADAGHQHHSAAHRTWSDVAHNFRGAVRAEQGGRTHFFCSEECRERFVSSAGRTRSGSPRDRRRRPARRRGRG